MRMEIGTVFENNGKEQEMELTKTESKGIY